VHALFIRTIVEWFNFVGIIFKGFHEMNTFYGNYKQGQYCLITIVQLYCIFSLV